MASKKNIKSTLSKTIAFGCALTLSTDPLTALADSVVATTPTTDITTTSLENAKNPNVIYIVLDDIGFSDLGAYGAEIKTPNIDELAASGLLYNNFNANPLSSATRAALLSGRENNSIGVGQVVNVALGEDRPGLQGQVTKEAALITEILQLEGYSTYGIGKWHLAPTYTVTAAGPFDQWPLSRGFDRYYGFMDGETDQYAPELVNGNIILTPPNDENYTLNDDLSEKAIQYLVDHVSIYPSKPFFMNYAFGTGHSPQQVPQSYIDMYDGVYDVGWDVIRQQRFERQKELGVIPEYAGLAEYDSDVNHWDTLTDAEKEVSIKFMQTYAGFITQADDKVGELVDQLKRLGVYEDTMIVLIADNGATDLGGLFGTDSFYGALTSGYSPTATELLARVDEIGGPDFQALYPRGWAQVSNTPFGKYKNSVYAGALRNPLIISWENGIKEPGIRSQYVNVTDITPTVLDIIDVEAPTVYKGIKQMPMYGESFYASFNDENAAERTTAITYLQGKRAIYHDGFKAVSTHVAGTSFDEDTWELFHIENDFSETINVAKLNPEKLNELIALFDVEAEGKHIYPLTESDTREMSFVKEDSSANRSEFIYYNGVGAISESASPKISAKSFTITVDVDRDEITDEGVFIASGDDVSGYAFYLIDNKLVFFYNKYGTVTKLVSDVEVPLGQSTLQFNFERANVMSGVGTLYIDGTAVGTSDFQTTPALTIIGLDIGKDVNKAVSPDYKELGEFKFSGDFDYLKFNLRNFTPSANANQGH